MVLIVRGGLVMVSDPLFRNEDHSLGEVRAHVVDPADNGGELPGRALTSQAKIPG